MGRAIAIVAAACEYPDARSPSELWELSLHGRRAFRRFPQARLALREYLRGDEDPDGLYEVEAAFIKGYTFDRARFLIPLSTFRGTDLSHWLALDVADRAISSLPPGGLECTALKDRTGVIIANTLTGEFSRAAILRYRWPFIEHQVRSSLSPRLPAAEVERLLEELECNIKSRFPAPDGDSLAGGLSNTIAGRIANHFGLRGGAHAVDGACASSLVGVVTACDRLRGGELDCAVVGAVDLSLDPFELVGFARNNALARGEMRVFDRDSEGFWPGEGCGVVVLATRELAELKKWPVLAWLRGTGLSGDGHGGLTRPTSSGQLLALQRAWTMADANPASADYFEAHGTGTPTGDPIELRALADLAAGAGATRPVPVGTIKANIGHTKAAAGMASLIKALSLGIHRLIPPTAGHYNAHELLTKDPVREVLRVPKSPESVDHDRPMWVGINSFGFGGINCHIVIEGPDVEQVTRSRPPTLSTADLRGELVVVSAIDREQLVGKVEQLRKLATTLSRAELVDLAAAQRPTTRAEWRAFVVATTPQDLEVRADALIGSLRTGGDDARAVGERWAWSRDQIESPRLAFLFSGQAITAQADTETWFARFPFLANAETRIPNHGLDDTAVLQPFLAEVAIASIELLERLGLRPHAVIGHSFGEISALHAAGAIDKETFRRLAARRGRAMRDHSQPGAMLAVETDRANSVALARYFGLDLSCCNAPDRHVLAGPAAAIAELRHYCQQNRLAASLLPTDRAFHSRLMQEAQSALSDEMATFEFCKPLVPVASTVTGRLLCDEPLSSVLLNQFTAPVRFDEALRELGAVDLLVELGGGAGLNGLVTHLMGPTCTAAPILFGSLEPLLHAVGTWWVMGGTINADVLFHQRHFRPFEFASSPSFFASPCAIEESSDLVVRTPEPRFASTDLSTSIGRDSSFASDPLAALQSIVSDVAGLPRHAITARSKLLADLHLNSLRARHVIATAARHLGITQLPFGLADIANATVGDVANMLESLSKETPANTPSQDRGVPGIEPWLAVLTHRWEDASIPSCCAGTGRFRVTSCTQKIPACMVELSTEDSSAPQLLFVGGEQTEEVLALLVASIRSVGQGLLVVQTAQLANGFAHSLAREQTESRVCVVEVEDLDSRSLAYAVAEFNRLARGYSELRVSARCLQTRVLAKHSLKQWTTERPISSSDVVLITGGAKGIGAATARMLAETYSCRLALIGRSEPTDQEVLSTLSALEAMEGTFCYVQADLTDPSACKRVLDHVESDLGPVSILIHSAGVNSPLAAKDLALEQLRDTVATKTLSLAHLLEQIPFNQLRLLLSYSSIIGELGLPGEAHYALANEWMTARTCAYAKQSPRTRCLPVAWSAWREVGMATRLDGVLDALASVDTRALQTEEALCALCALLESDHAGEPTIVTGRYGRLIDAASELPLLHRYRYLEWPRVYYPGIELVADCEVSTDTDRYLSDHAPFGIVVFPLVAAIEAMLCAANALQPTNAMPRLENLRIGDAITLSPGERVVLRTSAQVRPDGLVVAELRSSRTEFEVAHFSTQFSWSEVFHSDSIYPLPSTNKIPASVTIYGGLCFQGSRFQRVDGVYELSAVHCLAQLQALDRVRWFGPHQPATLRGGDPTLRDAVLHAMQACIPHHPVLPIGAERVILGELRSECAYYMSARQVSGDGDTFTFDVDVFDDCGKVVERWVGLRLARVTFQSVDLSSQRELDISLLESFVGRLLLDELNESDCAVGVCPNADAASSLRATRRALGGDVELTHDSHGRPLLPGHFVSIAHTDQVTMAVVHRLKQVSCDIEHQRAIDHTDWQLMLGERRWSFVLDLERIASLPRDIAALAVWSACECLSKIGRDDWPFETGGTSVSSAPYTGPLIKFAASGVRVSIGVLHMLGLERPTSVAVCVSDTKTHSHKRNNLSTAEAVVATE